MNTSPFADIGSPLLFGQPLEHFECVWCAQPATNSVCMMLRDKATAEKPSIILSYFICARCGAEYWEEAGKKVFDSLRESLS